MKTREILFEYGFESVNGIVKKHYHLHEIPNIATLCDVWNVLPLVYVRQFTGLTDKKLTRIFEEDRVKYYKLDTHTQQSHFDIAPEIQESVIIEVIDVIRYKNGAFVFGNEYEEDFTISFSASGLHNLTEIREMFIDEDGVMTDYNGTEINDGVIGFEVIGNIHQK